MNKVCIKFWLAEGIELRKDVDASSEIKSVIEIDVDEETPVTKLFKDLAEHHRQVAEKIFDQGNNLFYANIIVTLNNRIINYPEICRKILTDGDVIAILPMYSGG